MPKFMKDSALMLLDGGIESYLLGAIWFDITFYTPSQKAGNTICSCYGTFRRGS